MIEQELKEDLRKITESIEILASYVKRIIFTLPNTSVEYRVEMQLDGIATNMNQLMKKYYR